MSTVLSGLTAHLSTAEAEHLPEAFAGVLPLLRNDRERLRLAVEFAARLDYFEAAGAVAAAAVELADRDLLLEAAALCGNPTADGAARARVLDAVHDDRAALIRIDPAVVPATADEKRLHLQCWPGARSSHGQEAALAPVVVIDTQLDALAALRLSVRLDAAGASLRRLAERGGVPRWFGPETVLICHPKTRSRVLSAFPSFSERLILYEEIPQDGRGTDGLLRRVNAVLDGFSKLEIEKPGSDVETVVWDPDVFTAGVYPTREAAFLAAASASSLNYLHKQRRLVPREFGGGWYWNFRDVVAVRTWQYLKSQAVRRVSSKVVEALVKFAGDSQAVQLGATSEGDMLVDHGSGWVNAVTGQSALGLEITEIDAVFRPFDYGAGTAIDLLQASANTRLYPTTLNGTPHLQGHRISAKALASVEYEHGREAIEAAYPELEGVVFEDTVEVGLRLLKAG
ncbi:MAG: hypothetical protein OXE79_08525 [Acidimicrobiaceae bacterium]|nr:hypothetical protein [Acidimicrobiaceae bacterium]